MPLFDREELSWAAGLFTGEGTTGLTRNGTRTRRLRMALNMTTECDVRRFHAAVGGIGNVRGPIDRAKYNPSARPTYIWTCDNFEGTQAVIAALWFKLGAAKKIQAATVLKEFNAHPHRRRKPKYLGDTVAPV